MKKKLNWRLSKLPSVDELRELVKDKIITQDEARDILFNSETQEDRNKDSLKSEIKFLRELVEKLSSSRSDTVGIIREVERPYRRYPWYEPYTVWCKAKWSGSSTTTSDALYTTTDETSMITIQGGNFTDIKTF